MKPDRSSLNLLEAGSELLANVVEKLRVVIGIAMHRDGGLPVVQLDQIVTALAAPLDDFGVRCLQEFQELFAFHAVNDRTLVSYIQAVFSSKRFPEAPAA